MEIGVQPNGGAKWNGVRDDSGIVLVILLRPQPQNWQLQQDTRAARVRAISARAKLLVGGVEAAAKAAAKAAPKAAAKAAANAASKEAPPPRHAEYTTTAPWSA